MAFRGKCTFGTRPPMNNNLISEIIYREAKYYHNYKTYRPNFRAIPLASKFYASHDLVKVKESNVETQKVEEYADRIAGLKTRGPRNKYPAPVTSNQEYGWYLKIPSDRNETYRKTSDSIYRNSKIYR
ncbi:PREDICTED: uncharacterized protein LOC106125870 [Papilio xuthus]|uniref:Uncharacterized protein LOC106125870 n=1 Tax=Papilio xuthus TaxID=66420 RepID=A0AAJ6ZT75_PAPXU|nr:PREDICTED: uncharacterized protein LOC106125870 [Papilio xuthus]